MTREQAIAELNVQHAAGDIDADTYDAEVASEFRELVLSEAGYSEGHY